jgi:hypothetical protein
VERHWEVIAGCDQAAYAIAHRRALDHNRPDQRTHADRESVFDEVGILTSEQREHRRAGSHHDEQQGE